MDEAIPLARDIMSHPVVSVRPGQDLFAAAQLLTRRKLSGAPVMTEDGELVGVLSEHDVLSCLAQEVFHDEPVPCMVSDVMSQPVVSVGPDSSLFEVVGKLRETRRVPVVDGGRVVGIVARRDAARAMVALMEARSGGSPSPL
jgi:CBS domain-containing protein